MYKKAVILANGAFPTNSVPFNELKQSDYIVCCDGAINKLEKVGLQPYVIVGDLDSLDVALKDKYKEIIHHFADQDTNDLTKAVNWCCDNGFDELVIVGATGLRDDHMIGNVFLLPRYAQKVNVKMLTDTGVFTPIIKTSTFLSHQRQQVSLFSVSGNTLITTKNLKYPLTNDKLQMMWQGTLNESLGERFSVEIKGEPLVVFQLYKCILPIVCMFHNLMIGTIFA